MGCVLYCPMKSHDDMHPYALHAGIHSEISHRTNNLSGVAHNLWACHTGENCGHSYFLWTWLWTKKMSSYLIFSGSLACNQATNASLVSSPNIKTTRAYFHLSRSTYHSKKTRLSLDACRNSPISFTSASNSKQTTSLLLQSYKLG
jgi:hypothetical protein